MEILKQRLESGREYLGDEMPLSFLLSYALCVRVRAFVLFLEKRFLSVALAALKLAL